MQLLARWFAPVTFWGTSRPSAVQPGTRSQSGKRTPERSRLWEWFAKPLAGMRACLGAQQSSGTR